MKKIFMMIVMLFVLVSFAYADDDIWDCEFFENNSLVDWETNSKNMNMSAAMPKEAMEKAINNLTAYCCNTKKRNKDHCDTTNSDELYPESVYLFDHVLDVYLRRLDARQQGDNGADLLYNLEPDSSGKAWRNFITECGNDVKGLAPLKILGKNTMSYTIYG